MGTNYYWHETPAEGPCPHCGHQPENEALHIGKSSAGWCFSLNTHPERGIENLDDWRECWKRGEIYDEYGSLIAPEEMLRCIVERSRPGRLISMSEYELERNHARLGPEGLLRHRVDGRHCVANGDGTYDLMRGDFS